MREALRSAGFRRVLLSQWISNLGDRMAPVALAFAVLGLTHSAKDVGIVMACQMLPSALLVLPGGVIADRVPRRLLIIGSDLVRFVAQGVAAVLLLAGHPAIWALALTQVFWGLGEAFFLPAIASVMPEILSTTALQPANALMSVGRNIANILGPALAAAAIAASSAGVAVAGDSASFLISALLLRGLPRTPLAVELRQLFSDIRSSFFTDLRFGASEVWRRPWVRTVIGFFAIYHLAVMPAVFVLGPLLTTESYDGATSFAVIVSTFGVGAIVGGLTALRLRPKHPIRWVSCTLFVGACQPLMLGSTLSVPAMAAMFAVAGTCVSFGFTLWDSQLQSRIPAQHLARVASFDFFCAISLLPIGYAIVGPLASATGTRPALLGLGAIGALGAACTLLVREVRTLTQEER